MKVLYCADAGFDCKGIIKAKTDEEVLQQASKHASEVHGVNVTPEMERALKVLIKEEES